MSAGAERTAIADPILVCGTEHRDAEEGQKETPGDEQWAAAEHDRALPRFVYELCASDLTALLC
jgi:hypothetical protein